MRRNRLSLVLSIHLGAFAFACFAVSRATVSFARPQTQKPGLVSVRGKSPASPASMMAPAALSVGNFSEAKAPWLMKSSNTTEHQLESRAANRFEFPPSIQ